MIIRRSPLLPMHNPFSANWKGLSHYLHSTASMNSQRLMLKAILLPKTDGLGEEASASEEEIPLFKGPRDGLVAILNHHTKQTCLAT